VTGRGGIPEIGRDDEAGEGRLAQGVGTLGHLRVVGELSNLCSEYIYMYIYIQAYTYA
jgi:hypothetical protein